MTSSSPDASVLPFAQSVAPPDAIRLTLRQLVQDVIETEFHGFVGAARYARGDARHDVRNGPRARRFTTRVGAFELKIQRDRRGEFRPTRFARYQRSEHALVATLAEMYIQGVSTRTASAVVETLCGEMVSANHVSAMTAMLDATLAAWRARPLTGTYRYLVIDAHVGRVQREGEVRSTAVLWVIGVDAAGYR